MTFPPFCSSPICPLCTGHQYTVQRQAKPILRSGKYQTVTFLCLFKNIALNLIKCICLFLCLECGGGPDALMVLLAVVGSILLVGVVLLAAWKLVITVHDRREFARFQSARSRARYEMVRMNPPHQKNVGLGLFTVSASSKHFYNRQKNQVKI